MYTSIQGCSPGPLLTEFSLTRFSASNNHTFHKASALVQPVRTGQCIRISTIVQRSSTMPNSAICCQALLRRIVISRQNCCACHPCPIRPLLAKRSILWAAIAYVNEYLFSTGNLDSHPPFPVEQWPDPFYKNQGKRVLGESGFFWGK